MAGARRQDDVAHRILPHSRRDPGPAVALRLSLADGVGRSTRTLASGTLSIGRGERNDWVLPDPDRHLSKTHCVISVEGGRYVLTDLSTNGVHINGARQPTIRDSRVVLTDGDEFSLGSYTIVVQEVAADAGRAQPPEQRGHSPDIDPLDIDPLDDPLGRPSDPAFSHPPHHGPAARPADDPFDRADEARRRPANPDDDLFAGTKPATSWEGPSQPDHADAPRHAMPMPRVVVPSSPSDIDFDALIGDLSASPAGQPDRPQRHDPFVRADEPEPRPAAPRPVAPSAAPVPPAPDSMHAALAAFLDGAGVPQTRLGDDPEAVLRNVGQVFRALTEGLREVLMSRATIKGELRVEQTLLKANNNNALKFSFSVEEAVIALLSAGRPGYMPPLAAAHEAFDDIRLHELAMIAGVQTALMGLLHRFDPDAIEARLVQGVLASVRPGARKARLWESFRDLYKTIASEAEDDFQAVFGHAFAKAYKGQLKKR